MAEDNIDLTLPFTSFQSCRNSFHKLIKAFRNTDPAVTVLALQGLYHIENDKVMSGQFELQEQQIQEIRNFLRVWRCNSQLTEAYCGAYNRVPRILRSLTIYQTFDVPLFIDDYGKKKLLSDYGGRIEDICIDESTPIFHVTHYEEAQGIFEEKELKPSVKNIIEGCWFGLSHSPSVYGSQSFATTLSQLDVTGLHQGEIVSYKKEVNVILYAADATDFEGLKKPTLEAARMSMDDPEAYVAVSIFVPSRFLPSQEEFGEVFRGPSEVEHGPFCVKEKRTRYECTELSRD